MRVDGDNRQSADGQITLIQFCSPQHAVTVRFLGGVLRRQGHAVRLILVEPLNKKEGGGVWSASRFVLSEEMIASIVRLTADACWIGATVFSSDVGMMATLYAHLKRIYPGLPVVVGGPHPTLEPKQASTFADYVCVGDGDVSVVTLARESNTMRNRDDGQPRRQIGENIFAAGSLCRSGARRCFDDRKVFPGEFGPGSLDYSFADEYVVQRKGTRRITPGNAARHLNTFSTFYSRGCVYNCAFCAQRALHMRSGTDARGPIKKRERREFIAELRGIRRLHPWARKVTWYDPNVLSLEAAATDEILRVLKTEVGLPFRVTGLTFAQTTEARLRSFLQAGMLHCTFGVQSLADTTRKLLERTEPVARVKEVDSLLGRLKKEFLFDVHYEIILDIPWETEEDNIFSLRTLSFLKGYDYLDLFSLRYYPGTKLRERALREGRIDAAELCPEYAQAYRALQPTWNNFLWMLLRDMRFSAPLIRGMIGSKRLMRRGKAFVSSRTGGRALVFYSRVLAGPIIYYKLRRIEARRAVRFGKHKTHPKAGPARAGAFSGDSRTVA